MRRVLPLVIGGVLIAVAIAVTAALWPALPARTLPTLPRSAPVAPAPPAPPAPPDALVPPAP